MKNSFPKNTTSSNSPQKGRVKRARGLGQSLTNLNKDELRYRDIIENSNDGIILVQNSKLDYVNDRILKLLGYDRKEALRKPFGKFIAPEFRSAVTDRYRQMVSGHLKRTRNKIELYSKSGKMIPVEMDSSVVRIQNKPTVVSVIRSLEKLKDSPKNIRQVFTGMRCIVWHALITRIKSRYFWNMTLSNEDVCHVILPLKMRHGQSYADAWSASQYPDDKKSMVELSKQAIVKGKSGYAREFRCINEKNEVVWLSEDVRIKKISANKWRLIGVCLDITARKITEEALRNSEERYRRLIELSPDAVAVHSEGKILFVNPAGLKLIGANKPEDIIGKPVVSIVHPDSRRIVKQRIRIMSSQDEIVPLIEEKFMKLDGTPVDVEVVAMPLIYEGKPAVQVVIRDITDRKLSDEKIRQAHQRLLDIIEFLPDPVFVIDKEKCVIAWNRAMEALTGVDKSNMIGKGDYAYSLPFYGVKRPMIIDLLFMEHKFSRQDYEYIKRKGDTIFAEGFIQGLRGGKGLYIWTKASPLYDQDGVVVGAIESLRDITDRKQFEEKIKYLSYHDKLTDLYNRAFFEEELKRLDSEREIPISFILGDLNNLKMTNDAFGHQVGDRLLIAFSKVLKDSCRSSDIICRWGGDEFLILLPRTDHDTALTIIDRIRKSCDALQDLPVRPYVALGTSTKETKDADIINILKEAEDMMYRDKIIEEKTSRGDFIEAVQKAMWEKSDETKEHAEQLKKIATAMAKELGLADQEIKELALLAVLHDIGKVAVPGIVLSKPGALSIDEWNAVVKHPEIGYRITQAHGKLKSISDAVLSHHERWDGKGYPHGLSGKKIPLNARILAIVDTFDVMTSGRIYKAACGKDEAINEIVEKSGTQFDPSLVQVFLKVTHGMI